MRKMSNLPPVRSELVATAASCTASSAIDPVSSLCLTAMLSSIRLRTSPVIGSWRACSVVNRLSIDPPRGQAVVNELELRHLDTHARHGGRDPMFLLEGAEEEHVPPAAGAGPLPAEGALATGRVICLVDVLVGDARRHLLLVGPGGPQQLAELGQPAPQERVLHLEGQALLHPQTFQRLGVGLAV